MKTSTKTLFLGLIILLTGACSSGYKAYKQGDYYKACMEAVEKLRDNPRNEKAQYVLKQTYPLAQQMALREINIALQSKQPDNYAAVVYQYERLNAMASTIYRCPKAIELIPAPAEYHSELSDARDKAASQVYELGVKALNVGTIDQARAAYQYFQKANSFSNGYKDVLNLIEEARYQGTLRVAVERPRTSPNYQVSADFFSENLLADINKYFAGRLIRFYNAANAPRNADERPHQYLVLNFEDYSIGNIRDSRNTVEVKRDSVKVGTATFEGKKVDVYNTVTAKLTTNRREIISGGVLSVRVYDTRDVLLQQRNFTGEYVWSTSWGNFNGDERALTNEQKALCGRNPQLPPTNQDMFIEFTKPIYSQAFTYIRSIYGQY